MSAILQFPNGNARVTRKPVVALYDGTLFEHQDGSARTGWHATKYAALIEIADELKATRRATYTPTAWLTVQAESGIRRLMNEWQAEKTTEYYTDRHGNDRRRVRYGLGVLWRHRTYRAEREALNCIAEQAQAWGRSQGRTWLTVTEAEILRWDRYYMQHCQTLEFRQRYPDFAAPPFELARAAVANVSRGKYWKPKEIAVRAWANETVRINHIDQRLRAGWIAHKAHFLPAKVTELLQQIDWVYDLREALGMDGDAPTRLPEAESENLRAIA